MTERKQEIIYSEPVRTIMGTPPRAILRWGTTIITAVFVLFLIFAFFFRYPDLIPSPVVITTENPPVTLFSKVDGRIKLLKVAEMGAIRKGEIAAVIETAASFEEYVQLKILLDTIGKAAAVSDISLRAFSDLGELQDYYSSFRKSISELGNTTRVDYYGSRIKSVNEEITGLRQLIKNLKLKEKLAGEVLLIETNKFRRDSGLHAVKAIADAAFELTRQGMTRSSMDLQQVRLDISTREIEIVNKKQLIIELSKQREDEFNKLISAAEEALANLKARTKIWENTYLIIAPIDGHTTFTKVWNVNQSVNVNEPVLTIVPADQGRFIGRISLRMQLSGKVDTGQVVFIKLSSFPYLEYGMLEGRIRTKSLVPEENAYAVEISLPDNLITLYGKKLPFTQNMSGTAEIITNDRSLISKIFSPFRYLASRNRRIND